jgi:hypothetical protein
VLAWLEGISHYPCTEESAGSFASHLMLALARISRGEAPPWEQDVHEEAANLQHLIPWAEQIQLMVKQDLDLTLPPEEFDFILLHLAAFLIYYQDQ